ncbi:hypothetical protein EVAR_93243_1 [Eumeta japonica]|uniref:Uncharacterized protein n=1 Tax=Eumeta variegata TaxID=151549 RepID=A0A4C1TXP7_EUMVA|nr:hypothetical protein EVAR_93243_1 [Eumeta japonica]
MRLYQRRRRGRRPAGDTVTTPALVNYEVSILTSNDSPFPSDETNTKQWKEWKKRNIPQEKQPGLTAGAPLPFFVWIQNLPDLIKCRNYREYMMLTLGAITYNSTIKQKWSTSLRSRHIVDLALSESDQSLRSPGPAQIPSPAIPDRSSAQPSPSSSTSSPQFKRPKTVNVPDFNQPKNQAQADSEWGVDECGRMHVGHQEIADGAGGSSYDDSEFSDDDDAEYLVTSAKRRFSRIYQTMRSYHLSTFHDNSTYTGTSAGEECEKPICVKDCNTTMGALI